METSHLFKNTDVEFSQLRAALYGANLEYFKVSYTHSLLSVKEMQQYSSRLLIMASSLGYLPFVQHLLDQDSSLSNVLNEKNDQSMIALEYAVLGASLVIPCVNGSHFGIDSGNERVQARANYPGTIEYLLESGSDASIAQEGLICALNNIELQKISTSICSCVCTFDVEPEDEPRSRLLAVAEIAGKQELLKTIERLDNKHVKSCYSNALTLINDRVNYSSNLSSL